MTDWTFILPSSRIHYMIPVQEFYSLEENLDSCLDGIHVTFVVVKQGTVAYICVRVAQTGHHVLVDVVVESEGYVVGTSAENPGLAA